jgi:hypothetical protein
VRLLRSFNNQAVPLGELALSTKLGPSSQAVTLSPSHTRRAHRQGSENASRSVSVGRTGVAGPAGAGRFGLLFFFDT